MLFTLQVIPSIPWYTERVITNITLGGLLVLVVLRTIQYNMTKMRVSTWRHDAVNATTVGEKKNSLHYEFKISLVLLSVTAGVRTIVSSIILRHTKFSSS